MSLAGDDQAHRGAVPAGNDAARHGQLVATPVAEFDGPPALLKQRGAPLPVEIQATEALGTGAAHPLAHRVDRNPPPRRVQQQGFGIATFAPATLQTFETDLAVPSRQAPTLPRHRRGETHLEVFAGLAPIDPPATALPAGVQGHPPPESPIGIGADQTFALELTRFRLGRIDSNRRRGASGQRKRQQEHGQRTRGQAPTTQRRVFGAGIHDLGGRRLKWAPTRNRPAPRELSASPTSS